MLRLKGQSHFWELMFRHKSDFEYGSVKWAKVCRVEYGVYSKVYNSLQRRNRILDENIRWVIKYGKAGRLS
jgi:hypothetical protein